MSAAECCSMFKREISIQNLQNKQNIQNNGKKYIKPLQIEMEKEEYVLGRKRMYVDAKLMEMSEYFYVSNICDWNEKSQIRAFCSHMREKQNLEKTT